MSGLISVSDVVACHVCPRRFYFERSVQREESPRYAVCKQISAHLGSPLDPEQIWQEVLTVLPAADSEARAFFDECITACRSGRWREPEEFDVLVESERLGIRGRVDKIFPDRTFAVTRSSPAPRAGVYGADRLRIAAYAICLQETFGGAVEGGYAEYIPSGVARFVAPQPRDRRELLKAIRAAKKVIAGDIPKRPLQAPCEGCPHADRCLTGARRLSDLL